MSKNSLVSSNFPDASLFHEMLREPPSLGPGTPDMMVKGGKTFQTLWLLRKLTFNHSHRSGLCHAVI